jgi:hypothetical protein
MLRSDMIALVSIGKHHMHSIWALDRRSDTRILGMALLDEIRQDYAK